MSQSNGVARIAIAATAFFAIGACIWGLHAMFHNFAGGTCYDSHVVVARSPDARRGAQMLYRDCGAAGYERTAIKLKTGNTNPGYEFLEVVTPLHADPDKTFISWTSPDQLLVTFPSSAEVEEAYAKVLGVTITLKPKGPTDSAATTNEPKSKNK